MLMRIHMVETWGRGMTLIFDNEPGVQFEEFAGMFIANFARSSLTAENDDGQGKNEATIIKTSTKTSMKTGTKTTQASLDLLSKQEKDILQIIEEAPAISLQDIATKIGLSKNGARHHTDNLRKKGILRRIGGAKGGHWEIVQE
jgi:ATP-dependent DNA helicase RecG